mgnify:CR=1 FL=1|tara:strand:+ start:252 stop:428 length:177 start_codon:yes stop_codon:yes gene_type:complete
MTAPELLKAQMPLVRQVEANLHGYGYIKGTAEWREAFDTEITYYRQFCPEQKEKDDAY